MLLTIYLFWALFAYSLKPRVIWQDAKKYPAHYILITIILVLEFVTRRYIG